MTQRLSRDRLLVLVSYEQPAATRIRRIILLYSYEYDVVMYNHVQTEQYSHILLLRTHINTCNIISILDINEQMCTLELRITSHLKAT